MFPAKRTSEFNELVEKLENDLPFKNFSSNKLSKLRVLKATCSYLNKLRSFENLNKNKAYLSSLVDFEQQYGFIVCFSAKGKLVYLTENVTDHLGFTNKDILFTHDSIFELVCDQDINTYISLSENSYLQNTNNKVTFFSYWWVSKIRRKNTTNSEFRLLKMTGGFDYKTNLFIFNCQPVLSKSNREFIIENDPNCFKIFHKLNLEIYDMCHIASSLLEYNIDDINFKKITLYDLVSHESLGKIAEKHKELIAYKSTKVFVEHVRLLTKSGLILDCLMNIYVNNKGLIVANFQIMTEVEINQFNFYFTNIDSSKLTKTHDKSDEINDEIESKCFDYDEIKITKKQFSKKRKICYNEKSVRTRLKKMKSNEFIKASKKLQRENSAKVKIQSIKHKLIGEIQNLDHRCGTSIIDRGKVLEQFLNDEHEMQQNLKSELSHFEEKKDQVLLEFLVENQSSLNKENSNNNQEQSLVKPEPWSLPEEHLDSFLAMEDQLVNFEAFYDLIPQQDFDLDETESLKISNQNDQFYDYFNYYLNHNISFDDLSDTRFDAH